MNQSESHIELSMFASKTNLCFLIFEKQHEMKFKQNDKFLLYTGLLDSLRFQRCLLM